MRTTREHSRPTAALYGEDLKTVGEFTVEAGQSIPFVLSYGSSFQSPPPPIDLAEPDMMSKLYAGFLVIASLFAMAALGMLILILITDLSNSVIPSHNSGMSR
jgi:hypothetical protein